MSEKVEGMEEVRAAYDRKDAELKALTSEFRQYKAGVTFEQAGLTAKHAELYLATNPEAEVSPEGVASFAAEYGLMPAQAPAPEQPPGDPGHLPEDGGTPPVERTLVEGPQPADQALATMTGAAGTPAATVESAMPTKMSQAEFAKLLTDNPQEAAKAYAEGRAPRNDANVQADQLVHKGVIR